MWEDDDGFVAWLDEQGYATDDNPLEDWVIDLMFEAWEAGKEIASEE